MLTIKASISLIEALLKIAIVLSRFEPHSKSTISILVEADQRSLVSDSNVTKCHDCHLTSKSIDDLLKKPRLLNQYGEVEAKIDLDKIHKAVCKDIVNDRDRERCRSFYFSQLHAIQKWKQSASSLSFHDYVCIKELKFCCPRDSFGPRCSKCPECDINKECHGEGTRAGNGTCVCRYGHTGENCEFCIAGFYLDKMKQNATSPSCSLCHKSCSSCHRGGPLGCHVCKSGYVWIASYGCSDVDECVNSNNKICGENTFCVNTEGSYFCYECDRACDGCHGDGPDMCLRCAKGYKDEKGNCSAEKKTILPPEANYYRYAIYVGLCLCTCIILHNNVYIASLIGLGVALYIGISEYIMVTHLQHAGNEEHNR